MKKISIKNYWHIAVIVAGMCIYSLVSWVSSIKSVAAAESKSLGQIRILWGSSLVGKARLSALDNYWTYKVMNELPAVNVILGQNKWLFYADDIPDYEGTNLYSESEMESVLEKVLNVQNQMESRGIKMALIIPPNKSSAYSENMSDIYTHASTSRIDTLVGYLSANGVNIINPKEAIFYNKGEYQLYYSYDTHWNQLGAYIGVREILDTWGIEIPALTDRSVSSYPLKGNYHECATDDLANMAGLRDSVFDDESEYVVDGAEVNWQDLKIQNGMYYLNNSDAKIEASVLLIGDSFRISMLPALSEIFSDVYCTTSYDSKILDEVNPQYVIAEHVERRIKGLDNIEQLVK